MDEIIEMLEGLYLVYNPRYPLDADNLARLVSQYADVLEDVPPATFRRFCQIWRDEKRADGKVNTRFPVPAEMGEILARLTPSSEEKQLPWAPLAKAEYDALSLEMKIRHCTIMADDYSLKAGGMWAKGKGEGPIFPERYEKFWPVSQRCRAKADELKKMLAEARVRDRPTLPPVTPILEQAIDLVFEPSRKPAA